MSNQSYKIAVNNIYKEREDSIILGLTGRTGSGCSTIASILNSDYAEIDLKYTSDLDERNISEITNDLKSEEKKFQIRRYRKSTSTRRPIRLQQARPPTTSLSRPLIQDS